jgi:hypothetical protein
LRSASAIAGDDAHDTELLKQMLVDAQAFLTNFRWCGRIVDSYFGFGVGGVVAIFYFRITPNGANVDEWLWVIVGDIPPAYIAVEHAPNAACALDAYLGEMRAWVDAVIKGESVDEFIPVNVPPTVENAERLRHRLLFIEKKILSGHLDDLRA